MFYLFRVVTGIFRRSVNPASNGIAHYMYPHDMTMCSSGFSDLATALILIKEIVAFNDDVF